LTFFKSRLLELRYGLGDLMDANGLNLPMDAEFAIHAAAFAIREMDRDDLEENFLDLLHQRAVDRQMFLSILKDHGIDADIKFNYLTQSQLS
jgi:hypothetical protein